MSQLGSLGSVEVAGLTWRPLGRKSPTISDLHLTIESGQRVLLAGPSGSGKSTIVNALAGSLGTTLTGDLSGTVAVHGRIAVALQNPLDAIVAERIGRDVAFGPENLSLGRAEIWQRVDEALAAVSLRYGRDHFTAALSGGEQQRLALAGVIATRPDLLVLDEPTSMLDAVTATEVRDAILAVGSGRTLLVVEHRLEHWLDHMDRVLVLNGAAELVFDGSPEQFRRMTPPDGLWFPGAPAPQPLAVPQHLVEPIGGGIELIAEGVEVELVSRTLRQTQRHTPLRGFHARFDPGRLTAVTGRSGSGKSTALLALSGLLKRKAGVVTPDFRRLKSAELSRRIGWAPQNPELGFLTTSVEAEVGWTAARLGIAVKVPELLELFGLHRYGPTNPYRLSGGEKRRLGLLAALAHRPGWAVADEPTVGQDPQTWAMVAGWLTSARDAGTTVAVSTHDEQLPRDAELLMGTSEVHNG